MSDTMDFRQLATETLAELEAEIVSLKAENAALRASIGLLQVLADQRTALIGELLKRVPDRQEDVV